MYCQILVYHLENCERQLLLRPWLKLRQIFCVAKEFLKEITPFTLHKRSRVLRGIPGAAPFSHRYVQ